MSGGVTLDWLRFIVRDIHHFNGRIYGGEHDGARESR